MENEYMKCGYGNIADIENAIKSGKLDGSDLVVTKDTSEIVYITKDGRQQIIRSRPLSFNSVSDAETKLNNSSIPSVYPGQIVTIRNNNKYDIYTVQQENNRYIVEALESSSNDSELYWEEE